MLTFAVSAEPKEIINILYLATDKNEGLFSSFLCACIREENQRFINLRD